MEFPQDRKSCMINRFGMAHLISRCKISHTYLQLNPKRLRFQRRLDCHTRRHTRGHFLRLSKTWKGKCWHTESSRRSKWMCGLEPFKNNSLPHSNESLRWSCSGWSSLDMMTHRKMSELLQRWCRIFQKSIWIRMNRWLLQSLSQMDKKNSRRRSSR